MQLAVRAPRNYVVVGTPDRDARRIRAPFVTREDYEREYHAHLSNAKISVPTEERFAIGEAVRVSVELVYCDMTMIVGGVVLERVDADGAAGPDAGGGVLIRLDLTVEKARESFDLLVPPTPELAAAESTAKPTAPKPESDLIATIVGPDGQESSGRTRNLSSRGVLVSVSGLSIPIGSAVSLRLRCPESRRQIVLPGDVVRHVLRGSQIVALGIRFDPPDLRPPEVNDFLSHQLALEQSRHSGAGIIGAVDELGLVNLVQTFASITREGTLHVSNGAEEGCIAFAHGQLYEARVGHVRGRKALVRMLSWANGSFEFYARIDPAFSSESAYPLDAVLFDSMRLLDECSRIDLAKFPTRATIAENSGAREAAPDLDKVDASILKLCGTSVQNILDSIDAPDPEIYQGLERLLDREMISVQV